MAFSIVTLTLLVVLATPFVLGIELDRDLQGIDVLSTSNKTQYDENFAKVLLRLCAGSYSEHPEECASRSLPRDWVMVSHTTTYCDWQSNTCAFYVVVSPKVREMIAVFRGTTTATQLVQESLGSMFPSQDFYGAGMVSKYFYQALESLWPSLEEVLTNDAYKNFKTTFAGHSLGGALSSMAAMKAVLKGIIRSDQMQLYTFGEPRQGNFEYASRHDQLIPQSYRVVHRSDIVPHLPPCRKGASFRVNLLNIGSIDGGEISVFKCRKDKQNGYYHHGTEIWYKRGMLGQNAYKECVGEPKNEDIECSNSQKFVPTQTVNFEDHVKYFGHYVVPMGNLGCLTVDPDPDAATEPTDTAAHDFLEIVKKANEWLSKKTLNDLTFG